MKIALAGLPSADELILKAQFAKYAPGTEIQWLGLDSSADAVVFRAKFLDTPSIEKLIHSVAPSTVVSAVYRDVADSKVAASRGVYLLDLSLQDPLAVRDWVNLICARQANATEVQSIIRNGGVPAASPGVAKPVESRFESDKKEIQTVQAPPGAKAGSEAFPNAGLLQAVREGNDVVAYASGNLIYLLAGENKVRANHKPNVIPSFDSCRWSIRTEAVADGMPIDMDLRQWIWESLWNSTIDFTGFVDNDSVFQLKVWPQPRGEGNRILPLQVAALLQNEPASVAKLASVSQAPVERIKKLMFTMQLVGFVVRF